jgi:2-dehydropantoate 2-reductase
MNAIAKDGLFIDGIWGEYRVGGIACYTSVAHIPEQQRVECELALVTVKSYDTDEVMRGCIHLFPESMAFVSLQNGLGNIECITAHAGCSRVIGGRVIFGVVFVANGHVRVTVEADRTALGVPASCAVDKALVESCAGMFSEAGIRCVTTDAIEQLLWGKMLYNCSLNALATVLGTHYGSLLETGLQDVMLTIVGEIFEVASRCGVTLPFDSPQAYADILFGELIPRTYDHLPSMLQDISRGKRTEIDALNGYVVQLAQRHGCDVPYNRIIVELVQAMDAICRRGGND